MRDDKLAKRMFVGGIFGLPLLWCFNVLYFRKLVYGRIPFWDPEEQDENNRDVNQSAINTEGIPNFGEYVDSDSDESNDEDDDGE